MKIVAYEAKAKLAGEEKLKQDDEENRKKVTDLVEKSTHERKFLKAGSREPADSVLTERRAF